MPSPLPAILLAALSAIAALNVSAQTARAAAKATASAAAVPASGAVAAPRPVIPSGSYRSSFEGYQPFTDENVRPWKESNDTVRTVGGWRAYAKEASDATGTNAEPPKPAAAASGPRAGQSKP